MPDGSLTRQVRQAIPSQWLISRGLSSQVAAREDCAGTGFRQPRRKTECRLPATFLSEILKKNPVAGKSGADAAAIFEECLRHRRAGPSRPVRSACEHSNPRGRRRRRGRYRGRDPQNDVASQEGATPKPGSGARDPCGRPSERWRSGWDGEFESPFLQRRVCELSVPFGNHATAIALRQARRRAQAALRPG